MIYIPYDFVQKRKSTTLLEKIGPANFHFFFSSTPGLFSLTREYKGHNKEHQKKICSI